MQVFARPMFMLTILSMLGAASPATAAPVITGYTFSVAFAGYGTVGFSGTTTVDVSGGTVTIAAGAISNTAAVLVPVTAATAVGGLSIAPGGIVNGNGTFSPGGVGAGEICPNGAACVTGGGVGGSMDVNGTIVLTGFLGLFPLSLPLSPLGIGLPGTGMGTITFPDPGFPVTAENAPFTTRTAIATSMVGLSTTNTLTGMGATGTAPLRLVSPSVLSVDIVGEELTLRTIVTLTLDDVSVPEPRALLLIGMGIVGLARLRRHDG